jgi:hypothetical protein
MKERKKPMKSELKTNYTCALLNVEGGAENQFLIGSTINRTESTRKFVGRL